MATHHVTDPNRSLELAQTTTIADRVAEEILRAIDAGEYAPGEVLNDLELAAAFGVSRTPVREALQRLRVYRVIETSASRYTRVTKPGVRTLREGRVVWVALLGALLDTSLAFGSDAIVTELEPAVGQFHEAIAADDDNAAVAGMYACLRAIMNNSNNLTLLDALSAYLHRFVLAVRAVAGAGSTSRLLSALFGVDGDTSFLSELLDALRAGDLTACRAALSRIAAQEIPAQGSFET